MILYLSKVFLTISILFSSIFLLLQKMIVNIKKDLLIRTSIILTGLISIFYIFFLEDSKIEGFEDTVEESIEEILSAASIRFLIKKLTYRRRQTAGTERLR